MLLAYADDIHIDGRTGRDVTGDFSKIEKDSSMVNEGKTKMILIAARGLP